MLPPEVEILFGQCLVGDYDDDTPWAAVEALRALGTRDVFEQAVAWCASASPMKRARGAGILAQFGRIGEPRPFEAEAIPTLRLMLTHETDRRVLRSVICAFGYISHQESLPLLLPYVTHPDSDVRRDLAFALGTYADIPDAIVALISMMRDADEDVRDWATFSLGGLGDADTPEIREALLARVGDPFEDVRMEALGGLAKRQEIRIAPVLRDVLEGNPVKAGYVNAANLLLGLCEFDYVAWKTEGYLAKLHELAKFEMPDSKAAAALVDGACEAGVSRRNEAKWNGLVEQG